MRNIEASTSRRTSPCNVPVVLSPSEAVVSEIRSAFADKWFDLVLCRRPVSEIIGR